MFMGPTGQKFLLGLSDGDLSLLHDFRSLSWEDTSD